MEVKQVTMNTLAGVQGLIAVLCCDRWKIIYNEGGCLILRRNAELMIVTTTF